MPTLLKIVQITFGIEALVALLAALAFIGPFGRLAIQGRGSLWVLVIVALLMLSLSLAAAMSWWSLRRGEASGRYWVLTASVLNFPLLGLGTIVGISGLVIFRRWERVVEITARRAALNASVPGDGTFKYGAAISQIAQIGWMVAATTLWWQWGRARGLEPGGGWLLYLLQVEGAIQVNTILHECGHVLGGWASGMRVRSFAFGPVRCAIRSGKWRVEFLAAGLWGGGAAGLVATDLRDIRSKRVFTLLAGPIASLITASAATALTLSAPDHRWRDAWQFFALLSTFAWASAIVNMIPLQPENEYSDGAQIYQLVSGGPWADVHIAFSMVASSLVTPLRARQFDTGTLERAAAFLKTGERGMLLNLFLYIHHKDAGRLEEALRALDAAESIYPQVAARLHADLHAEFVCGNAVVRKDPAAAFEWWRRMEARGNSRHELDYWKAQTAVSWIQESLPEAFEAWTKAVILAKKLPLAGAYQRDRGEVAELGALLGHAEADVTLSALDAASESKYDPRALHDVARARV